MSSLVLVNILERWGYRDVECHHQVVDLGEKSSFMTKLTFSHWKKNKAKIIRQMLMIIPFQGDFGLLQSDSKSKVLWEIVRKI